MKVAEPKFKHYVSVPPGKGVRVEKVVAIGLPPGEVYAFWRRFENLSRFMRHIISITVQDELHSHWKVRGARSKELEWDAEIIEDRPGEMISWRSLPDADVDNAGSVWFTPGAGGRGTALRVSLRYLPPAGKLGALAAKLLGKDAETEIEEDLLRLKSLLETGEIPTNEGQPRGSKEARL